MPSAVKAFANDLSEYTTAETSIRFPLGKPLPLSLIRKITAFRVRDVSRKTGNGERDGNLFRASGHATHKIFHRCSTKPHKRVGWSF